MDVETVPDVNGPSLSSYLQFIPADRLNKAPVISINSFKNDEYNNVSITMPVLPADVAEGDAVRLSTETVDEYLERVPDKSKYEKYYDPATVNEAPIISIAQASGLSPDQWSVSLTMSTIFPTVDQAQTILGNDTPPSPALYPAYTEDRLNIAPAFTIVPSDGDEPGYIGLESVNTPLNSYAAQYILDTYRK